MYEIRCSININVFETGGDEAFNQPGERQSHGDFQSAGAVAYLFCLRLLVFRYLIVAIIVDAVDIPQLPMASYKACDGCRDQLTTVRNDNMLHLRLE